MRGALVTTFQDFRRVLGVCPCCGDVFRLTELMISYRANPKVTWLDDLEAAEARQQRAEERFPEDEETIRELARERGRRELPRRLREVEEHRQDKRPFARAQRAASAGLASSV